MPPTLVQGQVYTLAFEVPAVEQAWLRFNSNDPYPGGIADDNTNQDLGFKTRVTPGFEGQVLVVDDEGRAGLGGPPVAGERLRVHAEGLDGLFLVNEDDDPWAMTFSNAQTVNVGAIGVKAPGFLTMTNASQKSNVTYAQLDGGGAWTQASDRRLKEEIEPLEDLLERARPLEAVTFYYKGQDRERHPERQLGYIAQDVAEVFPQLVVDNGKHLHVKYGGFGVIAIGALQELVDAREAEIAALRRELEVLQAEIERDLEALAAGR